MGKLQKTRDEIETGKANLKNMATGEVKEINLSKIANVMKNNL